MVWSWPRSMKMPYLIFLLMKIPLAAQPLQGLPQAAPRGCLGGLGYLCSPAALHHGEDGISAGDQQSPLPKTQKSLWDFLFLIILRKSPHSPPKGVADTVHGQRVGLPTGKIPVKYNRLPCWASFPRQRKPPRVDLVGTVLLSQDLSALNVQIGRGPC